MSQPRYVKFDSTGVEALAFLEDGSGFAFLRSNAIGFVDTLKPDEVAYVPPRRPLGSIPILPCGGE